MTNSPRVIGLAGKMGSGKDTIAAMLRMRGYKKLSFGEALRKEVLYYATREMCPYGVPAWVMGALGSVRLGGSLTLWNKPTPTLVRRLLQWWGTDYRRAQNDEYWVDLLGTEWFNSTDRYVISDVRFRNEADSIRSRGGKIWRVTGRHSVCADTSEHVSERVDIGEADVVIDNRVEMYDLAGLVIDALERTTKEAA